MSVLIKGLKMPTGQPTRIVLNPNGQLFVDHGTWFTEYEAIELPDHGDLIDRDAIKVGLWEEDEYKILCEATVVIPAERDVKVCPLHSDDEVTEYCLEGPCTDEMEDRCPIAERSEDGQT